MAAILTAVVTAIGMLLTRRSAKDQTAVTGYQTLTTSLSERIAVLEDRDQRKAEKAQAHRVWDEDVRHALWELGVKVPPPPPLE